MDAFQKRRCLYVTHRSDDHVQRMLSLRGWSVTVADSPAAALKLLGGEHRAGLLDMSGFGPESYEMLEQCLQHPNIGWVMLVSARQTKLPTIRTLISKYCFDYATAPVHPERVVDLVGHAFGMTALNEASFLPPEEKMIGTSEPMLNLYRTIAKVAGTAAPVFISGESGTGKELTAAAVHRQSDRRDGPFIAINCGAIPHSLMQSELYGYEKGAFTGANQSRIGRIEAAHGGTLFLDEIGDLPMESQASLLRFLQEGQIQRLGGSAPISVNARVISATHVDIENAVETGRFRADLYHRLCVLRIYEPPLRARGADIELLANCMLERFKSDSSRRIRGFSPSAIKAMYSYEWPGNVRELINRIRRAIVMAEGRVVMPEDLELASWVTAKAVTLAEARGATDKVVVQQALQRHSNRLNEAAQELGISRVTLYRLIDTLRTREAADGNTDDAGDVRPAA